MTLEGIKQGLQSMVLAFVLLNVSAYTASEDECGRGDGLTASGVYAEAGRTVAADHLPFGAVVVIDGKEYVVEDRFGGGYTDRLDIFMEHEDECWEFGRRMIECRVFMPGGMEL